MKRKILGIIIAIIFQTVTYKYFILNARKIILFCRCEIGLLYIKIWYPPSLILLINTLLFLSLERNLNKAVRKVGLCSLIIKEILTLKTERIWIIMYWKFIFLN